MRERLQLEVQELVDIEHTGFVLFEELVVARFIPIALEHPLVDQVLRPLIVGIPGEQGIVQIEKDESHQRALACSGMRFITSRTSGSVTARRASSE